MYKGEKKKNGKERKRIIGKGKYKGEFEKIGRREKRIMGRREKEMWKGERKKNWKENIMGKEKKEKHN